MKVPTAIAATGVLELLLLAGSTVEGGVGTVK
jgi:hypothetical protein